MSVSPLDKALFLQGGLCFFCNKTLSCEEASVEHLIPKSRSGTNEQENLVACCKTLNGILGDMTLKEKLRVVLNQKGKFICPCLKGKTPSETLLVKANPAVVPIQNKPTGKQ